MQMMTFGAIAPLKNPLPFSNTPRIDNLEEVFRAFGFNFLGHVSFSVW